MTNQISIKAYVADLAGTTVDFGSCAPAGAFVALFKNNGITVTDAQARGPMGLHKRDHIVAMAGLPEVSEQWISIHGAPCTDADIDRLYSAFIPLQVACLPNYAELIPGVLEGVALLKGKGAQLGATTGYNREMLNIVLDGAKAGGLVPDAACCAEDVASGRPAPWMIFRAMEALNVYPAAAVVKIGDTIPDIDAGLNAGVWTIGVTATGNMVGLNKTSWESLSAQEQGDRIKQAEAEMRDAGAHYVVDDFLAGARLVDEINGRLANGERP